jgi:hydroxyethylthiazole kinase-like uncharacterized protein yjeF
MRNAEQKMFDAGTSIDALMETAAGGAAEWIRRIAAGRSITVLCGPGNNGGDGYVIARHLSQAGNAVRIVAPITPKTEVAARARAIWTASQGEVLTSGSSSNEGIFVDCLFGSGLTRALSGEHALLLRDLAARHDLSIAIDVPSGIASDSGALLNDLLPVYDVTLALGAWKFAHWSLPGRAMMGILRLVPIGIAYQEEAAELVTRPRLYAPAIHAHKYQRGLAAIVAGLMPGAALLAAEAAMRAGAGYVKLLADGQPPPPNPCLVVDAKPLSEALNDKRINAVLVGPGVGRGERANAQLSQVLSAAGRAVLDADALVLLGQSMVRDQSDILATPHDGELEVLCSSFSVIAETRRDRAVALARASGMVILAKGPDTVIAAPDGRIAIAPPAPSWLSVAGSGDVLAGIAVSRMANGSDAFGAAREAVWLHGEAARHCGAAFTAQELAEAVSRAYAACL